ncbi:hypothetical protein C0J52_18267 [Blattella germanica]|nr:hypothetical protein C0J52_18267 [Blattella germanica]PSN33645.1 hypothetical protein C0J52_18267 [Blattella germanica]
MKTCSLKRLNATMSRLDLHIAVLKDLPESALVDIVGNERIGSRYVPNGFAIRKDINLCQMLQSEDFQELAEKRPGLPNGCPVEKGNYTLRNYRIDESGLPDSLPVQDNWRVDITVKNSGKKLCSNHVFVYIDHNVGRNSG